MVVEKHRFNASQRPPRLQNVKTNPDSSRRGIEIEIILSNTTPRKHKNTEAKITTLTTINVDITTGIDALRVSRTLMTITVQATIATIIISIDCISPNDIGSDNTPHRSRIGTPLHPIYGCPSLPTNHRENGWSIRPARPPSTSMRASPLSALAISSVLSFQSSINVGLIDLAVFIKP